MNIDLESLGITQEDLQTRVVERICERVLSSVQMDENGNEYDDSSEFAKKINRTVRQQIDERIDALAAEHILPRVTAMVEGAHITKTNSYGEPKGEPMTFTEYLVSRAEAWVTEQVDYKGEPKGRDSYSWRGTQTRVAHMIHQHLHYRIEQVIKAAIGDANKVLSQGIEETCKMKLAEIQAALKVEVKTK